MVNICLNSEEKSILKSLIGTKLLYFKHDPLDKFGSETVYGRLELFCENQIVLIEYDYAPYYLFGSNDDDHPKFSIKTINEEEAVSALENTQQIVVKCEKTIRGITLVEDYVSVEWDEKSDDVRMTKAIILEFKDIEVALQGDYMMPFLDFIKGENVKDKIGSQADEFDDPETKYEMERFYIKL